MSSPQVIVDLSSSSRIISDYYKKALKGLPADFYQRIVELENEIMLKSVPGIESLRELGGLYKKAIEVFSGVSQEKVEFYTNKLTRLLIGANKIEGGKDKKKKSKFSLFIDSHKKNANKFMLFLSFESNKFKIDDLLKKKESKFSNASKKIDEDIKKQITKFETKLKGKKIRSKEKECKDICNSNSKYYNIETNLLDFIKKFHYVYLHNKVFTLYINIYNNILSLLWEHKVKKYFLFQEQIKQFELLLSDNKKSGGSSDQTQDLEACIKDLENERKAYFMALETVLNESFLRIKNKLISNNNIEDDSIIKKYLHELIINITKLYS